MNVQNHGIRCPNIRMKKCSILRIPVRVIHCLPAATNSWSAKAAKLGHRQSLHLLIQTRVGVSVLLWHVWLIMLKPDCLPMRWSLCTTPLRLGTVFRQEERVCHKSWEKLLMNRRWHTTLGVYISVSEKRGIIMRYVVVEYHSNGSSKARYCFVRLSIYNNSGSSFAAGINCDRFAWCGSLLWLYKYCL